MPRKEMLTRNHSSKIYNRIIIELRLNNKRTSRVIILNQEPNSKILTSNNKPSNDSSLKINSKILIKETQTMQDSSHKV